MEMALHFISHISFNSHSIVAIHIGFPGWQEFTALSNLSLANSNRRHRPAHGPCFRIQRKRSISAVAE